MKKTLSTLALTLSITFSFAQDLQVETKFKDAIPVLNMGTFHMGYTPDANKTEFDEHNSKNVLEVHKIAEKIAEFNPTVIIVEKIPENNTQLQKKYEEYLENPQMEFSSPSEIELLAYEVGRLSNTERIYGIDYKEGYNYRIDEYVENSKDTETYTRYMKMLSSLEKQYSEGNTTVMEQLKLSNEPQYLDMLMNTNADMLTHVSSEGNSEGADEASKFYHRNLVMYSNLNQIEITENDRVFILMGATHTAFFQMWLERSPKYKAVDVFQYLK